MDLSIFCDRKQIWNKHKTNSDRVAEYYADSQFSNYSQRMLCCGDFLEFQAVSDKLKLSNARFCRVRYCPICQWRRSLQWKAKAYKTIPSVVRDFPKDRWLFLTLTVKNCPIEHLRETLNWMHASFKRLTKLKIWSARGWIKSTEVTRGQDNLAHPHFHCLLIVPASYFSGSKYLSHAKWLQLWQQSLRVDYVPVVHIKTIKKTDDPTVLIPEILKYQTKADNLTADRDWLLELTTQLYQTRAIATGGILKSYIRQLEEKQEITDEMALSEEERLYFRWNSSKKNYQKTYNLDK